MKHSLLPTIMTFVMLAAGCTTLSRSIEPKSFLYTASRTLQDNFPAIEEVLSSIGLSVRTQDFQVGVISTESKDYEISPTENSKTDLLKINVNILQDRNSVKLTLSFLCGENGKVHFCTTKDQEAIDVIDGILKKVDRRMGKAIK